MITPHQTSEIPDSFVDRIMFEIPECPFDAVKLYLQDSVIQFCKLTNYWVENLTEITIIEGQETYSLALDAGKEIVGIIQVYDQNKIPFDKSVSGGIDRLWWQASPGSIDIVGAVAGDVIQIEAAIKPVINAGAFLVSVPVISDYQDEIIAGAKAEIYKSPRKPWTDLQQSQINYQRFIAGTDAARLQRARGFSRYDNKNPEKKRSYY